MSIVSFKQFAVLALIASATTLVYSAPAEAARAMVTRNANVHVNPNADSRIVNRLFRGDRVTVIRCGSAGRWCRVDPRRGRDGWVRSRNLDRIPGSGARRGGVCFYGERGRICLGR